jgi:hypothetical protein
MLTCWFHVDASYLALTGPADRCTAYAPSPDLSRSRESNTETPQTERNSIQSLSTLA